MTLVLDMEERKHVKIATCPDAYRLNDALAVIQWQVIMPSFAWEPQIAFYHAMLRGDRIVVGRSMVQHPKHLGRNTNTVEYIFHQLEGLDRVKIVIWDSLVLLHHSIFAGLPDEEELYRSYHRTVAGFPEAMHRGMYAEYPNSHDELFTQFIELQEEIFVALCHVLTRTCMELTHFRSYGVLLGTNVNNAVVSLQNIERFAWRLSDFALDIQLNQNHDDPDVTTICGAIDSVMRTCNEVRRLELVFDNLPEQTLRDTFLSDTHFAHLYWLKLGGTALPLEVLQNFCLRHRSTLHHLELLEIELTDGEWYEFFDFAGTMLRISNGDLFGTGLHDQCRGWLLETMSSAH